MAQHRKAKRALQDMLLSGDDVEAFRRMAVPEQGELRKLVKKVLAEPHKVWRVSSYCDTCDAVVVTGVTSGPAEPEVTFTTEVISSLQKPFVGTIVADLLQVGVNYIVVCDQKDKEFARKVLQFLTGMHKHTKIPPSSRTTVLFVRMVKTVATHFEDRVLQIRAAVLDGFVLWPDMGVYAWERDNMGKIVKIAHRSSGKSVDVPGDTDFSGDAGVLHNNWSDLTAYVCAAGHKV